MTIFRRGFLEPDRAHLLQVIHRWADTYPNVDLAADGASFGAAVRNELEQIGATAGELGWLADHLSYEAENVGPFVDARRQAIFAFLGAYFRSGNG